MKPDIIVDYPYAGYKSYAAPSEIDAIGVLSREEDGVRHTVLGLTIRSIPVAKTYAPPVSRSSSKNLSAGTLISFLDVKASGETSSTDTVTASILVDGAEKTVLDDQTLLAISVKIDSNLIDDDVEYYIVKEILKAKSVDIEVKNTSSANMRFSLDTVKISESVTAGVGVTSRTNDASSTSWKIEYSTPRPLFYKEQLIRGTVLKQKNALARRQNKQYASAFKGKWKTEDGMTHVYIDPNGYGTVEFDGEKIRHRFDFLMIDEGRMLMMVNDQSGGSYCMVDVRLDDSTLVLTADNTQCSYDAPSLPRLIR